MDEYASLRKIEFELCGGNLPEKYKAFVRRVLNDRNLIPAADVAPVVHGRWGTVRFNLETGNYEKQCTRCRNFSKEYGKPYCPHCSAKMDGWTT